MVASDRLARPGYSSKSASEFLDTPEVLQEKVKVLANMIRKSKNLITYTGAGISTASGVPDYASNKQKSIVNEDLKKGNGLNALPTQAHVVLTHLHFAGWLKYWIQQNHDGLPQKAGFPQKFINEIHGAWFDPSNPVFFFFFFFSFSFFFFFLFLLFYCLLLFLTLPLGRPHDRHTSP